VTATVIDVQVASVHAAPCKEQLTQWANAALHAESLFSAELTLRLVDEDEMTALNAEYRKKNRPTNVLSFPAEVPSEVELVAPLLGDIVICAPVVILEAKRDGVSPSAHWAHMVVHGVLHLLGYDHLKDDEADIMEAKEIAILAILGFDNPY
jgi:probable rRNA maturation factor